MEADLARFYGCDYRDRWRFDPEGRRKLTLRMVAVRLKHLPPDSAVNDHGWTRSDFLLDDVRRQVAALGGDKNPQPHPSRPKPGPPRRTVEFERRKRDALRRKRQRQRDIEAGLIT